MRPVDAAANQRNVGRREAVLDELRIRIARASSFARIASARAYVIPRSPSSVWSASRSALGAFEISGSGTPR